ALVDRLSGTCRRILRNNERQLMKIRTQLILAFILLSVVPLSGIVLYSYMSSQKAVRAAELREAEGMAEEMDHRVTDVRQEVTARVASLSDVNFGRLVHETTAEGAPQVATRIVREMGDAAPFVEAIEFVPALLEDPPEKPGSRVLTVDVMGPAPQAGSVAATPPVPPAAPVAATSASAVPAPPPDTPVIVIDVDELIRDVGGLAVSMDEGKQKEIEERIRRSEAALEKVGEIQAKKAQEWTAKYQKQMAEWERQFEASAGSDGEKRIAPPPLTPAEREELRQRARSLAVVARQASETRHPIRPPAPPVPPAWSTEGLRAKEENAAPGEAAVAEPTPASPGRSTPAVTVQPLGKAAEAKNQTNILFGKELQVSVRREGSVVGEIRPRIRAGMLIESILRSSERGSDEIPFAIDRDGVRWAANEPARETVQKLGIKYDPKQEPSRRILDNWVVATSRDDESGLTLGIAKPIREPLAEVRRAATRNFAYGLGLIGIALIGIIPLANHMTRDISLVTHGAERIAQGDLETEVPVRSRNELGALAAAFNRMAHDLRDHQSRLVEEERRRKDEEIQRHLLSAEFDRKTRELEDARAFQLALLPKQLPDVRGLSLAVHMRTATEVGGDYYDFHVAPEGVLTVVVGDATGHGARAGTMVTVVKSLFSAYHADRSPGAFLSEAGDTVRRMDLGRMAMALQLARFESGAVTLASAAMPPGLLFRAATREVEELAAIGMPLGSFGDGYPDITARLESGDTLLLMSDGFPELLDHRGEPFGYVAVEEAFRMVASEEPQAIIDALSRAADERTGGEPPNDDITFVVVKVA
ncbi:MAG TPA: SpoIIE family protein phosphatase, partial [Thermoanaerobaculia bacterium]